MALGDHCCVCFETDEDQREILAAYVAGGLEADHRVIYVAGSQPETVASWLAERGVAVADAARRGQLVVSSADDTYLSAGYFDPAATIATLREQVADALAAGYSGLRLTGEMTWALGGAPGSGALREYEADVQQIYDTGLAMGICQYDARRFGPEQLGTIAGIHPGRVEPKAIYEDAQLRIVRTLHPATVSFSGEIDVWNAEPMGLSLRSALGGARDIDVDLSGVTFCDVAGIRALVATAESLAGRGRLILHGLPPLLERTIQLIGWGQVPSLVIGRALVGRGMEPRQRNHVGSAEAAS